MFKRESEEEVEEEKEEEEMGKEGFGVRTHSGKIYRVTVMTVKRGRVKKMLKSRERKR